MDGEGFEENISMGLDYARVQPKVLAFEYTHFSVGKPRHEMHLEKIGYIIEKYQYDTVATKLWFYPIPLALGLALIIKDFGNK